MARRGLGVNNVDVEYIAADVRDEYPIPGINAVLHKTNHGRLPIIKVRANGRLLHALLDTGAGISYVPITSVYLEEIVPTKARLATAVNGSSVHFLGETSLKIQIGEAMIDHTLLVSPENDCPAEMLLGSDFIRKLNGEDWIVNFDLIKGTVTIGEMKIPICYINAPERMEVYPVRVRNTMNILPMSEAIIPVWLEGFRKEDTEKEWLLEDNQRKGEQLYMVARTAVKVDREGSSMVSIWNPSAMKISFSKGECIGKATRLTEENDPGEYVPPEANWEKELPKFPKPTPEGYRASDQIDLSKSVFTEDQKQILRDIIDRNGEAFVGPDGHLGLYNGPIRHRIDLIPNSKMPPTRNYRIPLEKREEGRKQVDTMLDQEIIRPSSSAFAAPVVLVKKAGGDSWRFCVDFRGINNITEPVQTVLPGGAQPAEHPNRSVRGAQLAQCLLGS